MSEQRTKFDDLLRQYDEAVEDAQDGVVGGTPELHVARDALFAYVRALEEADRQLAIWRYTHGSGAVVESLQPKITTYPMNQSVVSGVFKGEVR